MNTHDNYNFNLLPDNAKVYLYPDGHGRVVYCEGGFGGSHATQKRVKALEDKDGGQGGQKRAKTKLRDLCRCNRFDLFFTLTLDQQRVDRYSYSEVYRKLRVWLDNRVRRRGLKYVLVAEHHKDGAIHFHGLCTDVLRREDSGHKDSRGRVVWHLPEWTLGYTTAVLLDGDYARVCSYISKYITKGSDRVGGRWYYSGGVLLRPEVSDACLDPADVPETAYRFVPDGASREYAVWSF